MRYGKIRRETPGKAAASFSESNADIKSLAMENSIQPKLTIGSPNDPLEHEADAMADKVMSVQDTNGLNVSPGKNPVQRKCAHCEEEEQKMQRKQINDNVPADMQTEEYINNLNEHGQHLPEDVRAFYESRFEYDFSNVKIHTDSAAANSAQSVNALAYTSGSNIVFNSGQYAPDSANGKRLLAHELTHVVQQGQASTDSIQRTVTSNPDCGRIASLPMHDTATVRKGNNYSDTFTRPASGRVTVTVTASNPDPDCSSGNNWGVNVWQCHILGDENIEPQHTANFGDTISYDINLPTETWNTYEKFYLRIRVNCACDLDIRVS